MKTVPSKTATTRYTGRRDAAVVKLGVVGKFRVCRRVIVVSIVSIVISAANRLIGEVVQSRRRPLLPTRAFSWLKVPTSAFTFKTLIRHYAK